MRRILSLLLSLSLLAATQTLARAQAEAYAEITPSRRVPSPRSPRSWMCSIPAANSSPAWNPARITVYEDSQPRPVDALTESLCPGTDGGGRQSGSRAGGARWYRCGALHPRRGGAGAWANAQPADSQDDLSLVSLSGSLISHASAKDWFVSLIRSSPISVPQPQICNRLPSRWIRSTRLPCNQA
jgi:hypothetical protein